LESVSRPLVSGIGRCLIEGKFERLVRKGERSKELASPHWCSKEHQSTVKNYPSITRNVEAKYAAFGLRVCTRSIKANSSVLTDLEFWYKGIKNRRLDDKDLVRKTQWDFIGQCEWRPWSYCPKDSSGQRMVAVGYEAHMKNSGNGEHADKLQGLRLICRPLADVYID